MHVLLHPFRLCGKEIICHSFWCQWYRIFITAWWRHQMEIFSALLAICAGNSPVSGEFPAQRPVTRSFNVFFDQRPNKRLSKRSWGWWFETHSPPLWRHSNGYVGFYVSLKFNLYPIYVNGMAYSMFVTTELVIRIFYCISTFDVCNCYYHLFDQSLLRRHRRKRKVHLFETSYNS